MRIDPANGMSHGSRIAPVNEIVDGQDLFASRGVEGERLFGAPEYVDLIFFKETRQNSLLPQDSRQFLEEPVPGMGTGMETRIREGVIYRLWGKEKVVVLRIDFLERIEQLDEVTSDAAVVVP